MDILNLTTRVETYSTDDMRVFSDPPKLHVEYSVMSDKIFYTYIVLKIDYTDNEDAPRSELFQSDKFYTSNVHYSINYPANIPVSKDANVIVQVFGAQAEAFLPHTIAELTEKVAYPKYAPASTVSVHNFYGGYLKAFCNFNNSQNTEVYCIWEKSSDGIHYTPVTLPTEDFVYVKTLPSFVESSGVDLDTESSTHIAKPCYLLKGVSELDTLSLRHDVLEIPAENFEGTIYSFKIFTLKKLETEEDLETFDHVSVKCRYAEDLVLDYSEYNFTPSNVTELIYSEFPNATSGKLFYSNSVAFAYGSLGFKNNILASNVGELVTPISRVIDLPSHGFSKVTALTSWRNYIIAATDFEMFLISKTDGGFTTKLISTFIGVPTEDYRCFKATANGLIFKSHGKVYMFYPNMYSSDESVLNLTDISKNVEDFVEDYPTDAKYFPFSLSTESAYYLIMPDPYGSDFTKCLKYAYNTRIWTYFEYPVLITNYTLHSVNDIVVYGYASGDAVEYNFESDSILGTQPYGDVPIPNVNKAISFEIDSGQKTDSLNHLKQFVESKFNVVTLHEKDSFPMKITVHIDGCPFVTTKDVNTDSAFWKQDVSQVGTLSTNFTSNDSDIFNVFRQMFIRYSGKGKSIRHIVEGESLYPFKIYEIDYRYRNLNVKQ